MSSSRLIVGVLAGLRKKVFILASTGNFRRSGEPARDPGYSCGADSQKWASLCVNKDTELTTAINL